MLKLYSDLLSCLPYAPSAAMYMATPTSGFSLNACYWFAAVISFIHGKLSQPCILYDEALICRGRGRPSPCHAQPCTPPQQPGWRVLLGPCHTQLCTPLLKAIAGVCFWV